MASAGSAGRLLGSDSETSAVLKNDLGHTWAQGRQAAFLTGTQGVPMPQPLSGALLEKWFSNSGLGTL